MRGNKWKKGFALMLVMAVLLSSVSMPSQTVRAVKKTDIPKTSEMNKQNFVLIKGGTFQMGSPNTENWRAKDE